MFNIYFKTVLIAILTAVLFGCGGETDEAKKLGFASVDEMKAAHAKGWHTQQQYYKDNPSLASRGEDKKATEKSAKASPISNSGSTGSLEVILANRKNASGKICRWYWEIRNRSDINFTQLSLAIVLRDSSGNIVEKSFLSGKLVPNGSDVSDTLFDCSATIVEITSLHDDSTKVDGEYLFKDGNKNFKAQALALPIRSGSNVAEVTMKSAGGTIATSMAAASLAPATAPKESSANTSEKQTSIDKRALDEGFCVGAISMALKLGNTPSDFGIVAVEQAQKAANKHASTEAKWASTADGCFLVGVPMEKSYECLATRISDVSAFSFYKGVFAGRNGIASKSAPQAQFDANALCVYLAR